VIDALIDGQKPSLAALNALAAQESAICVLTQGPGENLRPTLRPQRPSTTGVLLLAVMRNLSELEPSRLRRCAREKCRLRD
jgi:hypothetical protein